MTISSNRSSSMAFLISIAIRLPIPNVVPYMNHDPLSVGDDYGIGGGVCNVVYFPNVFSLESINNKGEPTILLLPIITIFLDFTLIL